MTRSFRALLPLALLLITASVASAEIVTKAVPYQQGDVQLEGYLAYDDSIEGKRPGVLVFHEWWGLNDYAKDRARELAKMGYVAFAADMYGKGVTAKDRAEAAKMSSAVKSTDLVRTRSKAAFDVLAKHELVDPQRIAAIG